MACKIEDCENKPITRGKYCEIHRIGKICKEPNCKTSARQVNVIVHIVDE